MSDTPSSTKQGPLSGLTIIEMAGLGPVPMAGLILSEMGATVIRIERLDAPAPFIELPPEHSLDRRGRAILAVDVKRPAARDVILRLAERADILIEGYRPGVMERLGLGPTELHARNPRLIYGRMTGFGQDGPLSGRAGHDLTYLAYSGVLHAVGHADGRPVPPLNLIGDYGGGTMVLMTGILAALFERTQSGKGQVIDAAMLDGASLLATTIFALLSAGLWQDRRGSNLLDSGSPFYDTYETADGRYLAVACLEPRFFAEFASLLPLDDEFTARQYDRSCWAAMREAIARRVGQKSRDAWAAIFEPSDACVAPVLSLEEAKAHPHNRARGLHMTVGDLERPAPAPRFSRTPSEAVAQTTSSPKEILLHHGLIEEEIAALVDTGVLGEY